MPYNTIISPAAALALTEPPIYLDVRHDLFDPEAGKLAYQAGHLPEARFVHLDADLSGEIVAGKTGRHPLPDKARLKSLFGWLGIGADRQVIAYDDKGGGLAARAWWLLHWLGHRGGAAVLDGGIQAWANAGGQLTTALPEIEPVTFTPGVSKFTIADAAEVDRIRRDDFHFLIDSRTADRYRGEVEPIDPVAGHIESALNLPWIDNLGPDGRFLAPADLRNRLESLGRPVASKQYTFYCGSGVTACHNILAQLVAGGEEPARLYPGSWSEWIALGKAE